PRVRARRRRSWIAARADGGVAALALPERADGLEATIGGALLRRDHVRLRAEIGEIDRLAEVHVDGVLVRRAPVHLRVAGDALAHAEDEDGDDLRTRCADGEPPDARLRRQERVRVGALVPRTFRVHPEDRADVLAVQLLDAALEHVVVEPALFPRAHDRR